jgi:hypothetical protein
MPVKIGDRFNSIYADSQPEWVVTEKRGRGTWIAQIDDDSGWAGVERAFTTQDIENAKASAAAYSRMTNEHDRYYASLKVGQIVHYDNGHNTFVRCEVVLGNGRAGDEITAHGKALKPIALVGNWREHDLPRRQADGSVYNGYHADQVINGGLMEPNFSSIYEARDNEERAKLYTCKLLDPRDLPAVSLAVPDMSESEKNDADLVRLIQDIAALTRYDEERKTQLTSKEKLTAIYRLTNSSRALRHMA